MNVGRRIYNKIVVDAADGAGPIGREGEYCFNPFPTTQDFEIVKMVDDFNYAQPTDEGDDYYTDERIVMYEASYAWQKYTHGYGWTEEADFTDQYSQLSKNAALVKRAIDDTRAKSASDLFNNGFDTTNFPGIDTVSLFNTAHPTAGGPTWANRPAIDIALSALAVGQMVQEMMVTRDRKNRIVPMSTKSIVLRVPPALHMTAKTIVASALRPGTANNDSNVQRDIISDVYTDRLLTSTTAWFGTDSDKSALGLFMMTGISRQTEMDAVPKNGTVWFYTRDSWLAAWDHARRTWGTSP